MLSPDLTCLLSPCLSCNTPSPRLSCAQLIRVCSEHGQAVTALSVYEWMKAPASVGGAGLAPTVYTYTAAMRAALAAGLLDRALRVWEDAQAANCPLDCRLCITYIEVRVEAVRVCRVLSARGHLLLVQASILLQEHLCVVHTSVPEVTDPALGAFLGFSPSGVQGVYCVLHNTAVD